MKRCVGILLAWVLVFTPVASLAQTPITTRASKGAPLTYGEMDANFTTIRDVLDANVAATAAAILAVQQAQQGGTLGYQTAAAMNADLAHAGGTLALVTNDATTANNTYWIKLGDSGSGSWQKSAMPPTLPLYDARNYANLATAISALAATNCTLVVSTAMAVTANLTTLASTRVWVLPGGRIDPDSTKVVTINAFQAGAYQTFGGAGTIVFKRGAVPEIRPEWYGVHGDGADTTAAVQTCFNSVFAGEVKRVQFGAGLFRIDGTIRISDVIDIEGVSTPTARATKTNALGATVFFSDTGTADMFYIYSAVDFLSGFTMRNVSLMGSDSMIVDTNAVNRTALHFKNMLSESILDNVNITGFHKQAIFMESMMDTTIQNSRIMYCGTDTTQPAIYATSSGTNDTNALKFTNNHMEHCPFMLKLAGGSRQIKFIGNKFEIGNRTPAASPFQIDATVLGTVFTGNQFVNQTNYPYVFDIANNQTIISNNIFDSGDRARWINHTGSGLILSGNTFHKSSGANYPFLFNDGAIVTGNYMDITTQAGARYGVTLHSNCVFRDNVLADSSGGSPTGGFIFYATGVNTTIKENKILGSIFGYYASTDYNNNYFTTGDGIKTFMNNAPIPDVSGYDHFIANNSLPTTITDLVYGHNGKTITIYAQNGNTTIAGTGNIVLKGYVNFVMPTGAYVTLQRRNNSWSEVSRTTL